MHDGGKFLTDPCNGITKKKKKLENSYFNLVIDKRTFGLVWFLGKKGKLVGKKSRILKINFFAGLKS